MNFKETIKLVKSQYNIVDYMRSSGLNLVDSGNNTWKALCPFHNEKTPSFSVSEDFQNYRCFGCQESGDIITYVEKLHTIGNGEALKMLADEKGINITYSSNENFKDLTAIKKVVEDAAFFYREEFKKLPDSHPAKLQVSSRGLNTSKEIYGYSTEKPNELYKFLKGKGHSDANIEESKLVIFYDEPNRQPWDFFHGRLMITLTDYLGKPVSFTARKIYEDDKMAGKYVNGKESPIFLKKNNLFGADTAKKEARAQKLVYVVEGQFDRESMYENGIQNVVAASGTAFTKEHANMLLRMVGETGKIVFIMDGDSAGIEASLKIFASAPVLHSNSHAILLKDGKDPCDFIVEFGVEEFKKKITNSKPIGDFVIEVVTMKLGGQINMNNRQEFVSEVAKYAKTSSSKQVIEQMLSRASIISAFSIDSIMDIFNKSSSKKAEPTRKPQEVPANNGANKISIPMNSNSEADMCMYNALALLIRMPYELEPRIPESYHKKFSPFIGELKSNLKKYREKNENWRFMVEEYSDSTFAKLLIDKVFFFDPYESKEETISQFSYLFSKANEIYSYEYEEFKKSQALSSIAEMTDPKKIAEALKYYKELTGK